MKKKMTFLGKTSLTLILVALVVSCVPTKKLSYFNDIDELQEPVANPKIQKTILPFDRLYVKVLSIDPQTTQIFNTSDEIRFSGYGENSIIGYLVDEAGEINFPFVGKINVASLTTAEASLKIQNALNEYVANTSVTVKFIDNKVSVLGEVTNQGVYSFSQDKINIYEALALGGGLTRYGNRKNVILMRQEGEKIMHHKLDLSDSKIASKEFYYIHPNDVLVVEPLKSVSTSYQNNTWNILLTTLSTAATIITIVLANGTR
jgi:polysaccharide export outer membrane protein